MQVTHSFRGNLKDMLRDAGVSKELNNYITGHAQGDVDGNGPAKNIPARSLVGGTLYIYLLCNSLGF